MVGKLYGLGVGPGDPELLTLKALRRIKESEIIAVPGKKTEESVAYKLARQAYPQIENKEIGGEPSTGGFPDRGEIKRRQIRGIFDSG